MALGARGEVVLLQPGFWNALALESEFSKTSKSASIIRIDMQTDPSAQIDALSAFSAIA